MGLQQATQPLQFICLNLDSHSGRTADCVNEKEDSEHNVCHCPALPCKRYKTLGCMCLNPKDLENVRVNGLRSLVANTRLGTVS